MLSRKYSISGKKEIEQVARNKRAIFSRALGVKKKSSKIPYPRFVIVLSNKITKKAALRNKIRRQIRAILYRHLVDIKKNCDIMIICRRGIVDLSYQEIEHELVRVLKKSNLI